MLYDFFKFMAFKMDAEKAHELSIKALSNFPLAMADAFGGDIEDLKKYQVKLNSMNWSFPVGLAAGLDKNAKAINFFSRIPFGAVEVGTVTPLAQIGNDRPRLFRYIEEESLRNCMGFNNDGAEKILRNIQASDRVGKILGVNLGKNKTTSAEEAHLDYLKLFKTFKDHCDYLVINVSSPNTPGLRDLQRHESMREIFESLEDERKTCRTPLFIKISPDLPLDSLEGIVSLASEFKLSGIIATNTTIMEDRGIGGVSGKLLTEKGRLVRERLLEIMKDTPELDFIGVGGISNFSDVWDFWKSGGKACQIYSSFIFQGPSVLQDIKSGIDEKLKVNDLNNLEELFKNIKDCH
ncbi:quinone-dependent dihydroorotate dehydrogenase [Halobacteriovorax sp. JY17]|uniref:quinone-dependent dihydroorotate dehydrogenase n=1 Tax=Halobacteriovorax sp. JY17 TaxID=2014617 RepID=UPI000C4D2F79|nr:quinone-dependent dihydroorotate dehydrogenase [Halobacteriovorax sp. JY17]PIK16710.1 MAG: dihydroorotate dehydrogenase (quinone) [Halobacteriovorax sp. JY17]